MAATSVPFPTAQQNWLDRAMGVVAKVEPGEVVTALLLTLNAFFLLSAYYFGIKPVREALILAGKGGAEIKSYTGALLAGLFLFIVPAYGAFASRVNRMRLINSIFLFFISNLLLFFVLGRAGVPVGIPFFLWAGIFGVMVIAQFWSFANDLYTPEQGKRLFAIVGFGSALGSVTGSEVADMLGQRIDPFAMMAVSAGLLLVALLLTNIVHRREKNRPQNSTRRQDADRLLARDGGFQLVLRHRYLFFIGLLVLILNVVNTNGEYMLSRMFAELARTAVATGAAGGHSEKQLIVVYYARFHFWQNVAGTLIQFFLVSRIFKYVGVRWALFIMPLFSMGGYSLFAAAPALVIIRLAKIVENSLDYSLQNTVRQALFLPTSREAKYKAKQAIETFFWRTGDMVSALMVLAGIRLLNMGMVSAINAGLVVAWLLLAAGIAREHRKLTAGQTA